MTIICRRVKLIFSQFVGPVQLQVGAPKISHGHASTTFCCGRVLCTRSDNNIFSYRDINKIINSSSSIIRQSCMTSNFFSRNGNAQRCFSTSVNLLQEERKKTNKSLIEARESPYAGLSKAQQVKEVGKDASYVAVIILGIGMIGVLLYFIGSEIFSGSSVNGIYSSAYKKCKQNKQIIDTLGEPIKGYGETTSRGRRRHTRHSEFLEGGVKVMRMQFYVEGPHRKGTVTVEAKQNEKSKYEIQFIYVELSGYPSRVIVVEDNR